MFKYLLISLLLAGVKTSAQILPNIGFEKGNFDNWKLYAGHVDSSAVIYVNPSPPIYERFVVINKTVDDKQLDPYGNFPVVCPNGSKYSIRLGDLVSTPRPNLGNAERLTYTFTVPNINAFSIIFNYAVVLQNPSHDANLQPRFTAQIYDISDDTYITCPSFNFVSGTTLPGFSLVKLSDPTKADVYYKDWSTATIDLHNYIGKSMRLEFTTNDCAPGGHFGYAYLDIDESSSYAPISGNSYCNNQNSVTLYGPTGFASYEWYSADLSTHLGSGQSITLSPAPPNLTQIALKVSPYAGLGCDDILYTTINKIGSDFVLKVADIVHGCIGVGADLTAAAVTAGSSTDMTYSYYTDIIGTEYLHDPSAVTSPGKYYIKGVNAEGCLDILPIQVVIDNPTITVTKPKAVIFPATVDISKTYFKESNLTYNYYSDAAATKPLLNYYDIAKGGTYYIKAVNNIGCDIIAPVDVTINPPLPYIISAPNTFTPNGDGINDYFGIHIDGFVSYSNLKIFNRYGQLMFTSNVIGNTWDGTFGGKIVPVGSYYWVFDGIDQYYGTKVTQGGSITIVR